MAYRPHPKQVEFFNDPSRRIFYAVGQPAGLSNDLWRFYMQEFNTGAKRSSRMMRFDLIPRAALYRLAKRFTGEPLPQQSSVGPTVYSGGALKYGEGNWEKGLPTSDVLNHIYEHLTSYSDAFRASMVRNNCNMKAVGIDMIGYMQEDDHLAGAMWGLAVLMHQEDNDKFYHDDKFRINPKIEGLDVGREKSWSKIPSSFYRDNEVKFEGITNVTGNQDNTELPRTLANESTEEYLSRVNESLKNQVDNLLSLGERYRSTITKLEQELVNAKSRVPTSNPVEGEKLSTPKRNYRKTANRRIKKSLGKTR